jgi:hypothetical protein
MAAVEVVVGASMGYDGLFEWAGIGVAHASALPRLLQKLAAC